VALWLIVSFALSACDVKTISDGKIKVRISETNSGAGITEVNVGADDVTIYAVTYDPENIGDSDIYKFQWYVDGEPEGPEATARTVDTFIVKKDSMKGKTIKVKVKITDLIGGLVAESEAQVKVNE
jgi:hypothetical protein